MNGVDKTTSQSSELNRSSITKLSNIISTSTSLRRLFVASLAQVRGGTIATSPLGVNGVWSKNLQKLKVCSQPISGTAFFSRKSRGFHDFMTSFFFFGRHPNLSVPDRANGDLGLEMPAGAWRQVIFATAEHPCRSSMCGWLRTRPSRAAC